MSDYKEFFKTLLLDIVTFRHTNPSLDLDGVKVLKSKIDSTEAGLMGYVVDVVSIMGNEGIDINGIFTALLKTIEDTEMNYSTHIEYDDKSYDGSDCALKEIKFYGHLFRRVSLKNNERLATSGQELTPENKFEILFKVTAFDYYISNTKEGIMFVLSIDLVAIEEDLRKFLLETNSKFNFNPEEDLVDIPYSLFV